MVAASVSDSGPVAGTPFTLSAAVRNAGNKSSAATTLRFYRSTDATITTSDREVGTGAVAGLAASGISSQSLDVSAPSTPGTYYFGACVDAVAGESDTTNNCSSAVQIKVPEPDLVLAVPTVSNSAPAAGARFTLSATVRNDGGEASAVTTMRFYQSTERDHHAIRHASGHGRSGGACPVGNQQPVGDEQQSVGKAGRSGGPWNVLLPG